MLAHETYSGTTLTFSVDLIFHKVWHVNQGAKWIRLAGTFETIGHLSSLRDRRELAFVHCEEKGVMLQSERFAEIER